jgi:enoyl-CoA hydratase/carnithine racemase
MQDKSAPLICHREDEIAFIEINRPQKKNAFKSHVIEYVKSITANSPGALHAVKEIIDSTPAMAEVDALAFEREKAAENILSRQCIEGISSFLERRSPKW